MFPEFGHHTVERASLPISSGGGSEQEIVVLEGKESSRSKGYAFPMEQISRESEREPAWG